MENAIKFSEKGDEIRISISEEDSSIICSISDDGIGIPSNEFDKIFTRFYQVGEVITRKFEGAGLGLSIVNEIIIRHNGKIWVESEDGKGSTFHIKFPKNKLT